MVKGTCKILAAFWILSEIIHLVFLSNKIVCMEGLLTVKPSAVYSRMLETDFSVATSFDCYCGQTNGNRFKSKRIDRYWIFFQILWPCFCMVFRSVDMTIIKIFHFFMEKFSVELFQMIKQDLVKFLSICM